ncbi:MAG: hypothetical protein AB1Z23_06855 [Eubacteriales bacterium]
MKKLIVIFLIITLFAMSTAYAVWTDSVSTRVTATSAVVRMDYTRRQENSNKIDYTIQNMNPLSNSNPYFTIEENVTNLNLGDRVEVRYTLENTGDVAVTLDGFSFTGKAFDPTWDILNDSVMVDYEVTNNSANPHFSATSTVSNLRTATQVTFANSQNNILQPGDTCRVTVTYYRESVWWLIDIFSVDVTKTDHPMYSVYR